MPDNGAGGAPTEGAPAPTTPGAGPSSPDPQGAAPTTGATPKLTKEQAHEVLEAAGLAKPPKSTGSPRRLLLYSVVVLVILVVLVVASLVALAHLKTRVTTTTTVPPTSLPTTTSSPTTSSTIRSTGGPGLSALAAYAAASRNELTLRSVGAGGQPLLFERTTSKTFITDRSAAPVVVYWWNGTCAPCAPENLVVVSALESIGGTFTGLTTTTEPGGVVTIDLRHASYHGPVVLQSTEVDGPNGRPDQHYSAQAQAQFQAYDRPPFAKVAGGYPFLDIGGHFVQIGPGFAPALLSHLSMRSIARDLATADLPVTRAIDGNADELAAAICVTLSELSRPRPLRCENPSVAAIVPGLPTVAPHTAIATR